MSQIATIHHGHEVWMLRTLGHLELIGAPPPQHESAAAWAVLAYVCVRGQPVTRQELMYELFGEQRQKAHVLRNAIYLLRRWLGDALVVTRHSLALAPQVRVIVDAEQFLQSTGAEASLQDLVGAVDRYRGPFLLRPLYGWSLVYAQRLYDRYVESLYRIVQLHAHDAQQFGVIRFLKALINECPWDDTLHERYVYVLLLHGMADDALAYLTQLQQQSDSDETPSAAWFARMHQVVVDVGQQHTSATSEARVIGHLQDFRDNVFHLHTTLMDQLAGVWQSFAVGGTATKRVQLVGMVGSGKTYIAQAFCQAPSQQVRVLLSNVSPETVHGDEFVRRFLAAMQTNERLATLIQQVSARLPAPYQAGLARMGQPASKADDGFVYFLMQKEVIRALLREITQQVALVLVCDDVSAEFVALLDAYTQDIGVGVCVTTTEAFVWADSETLVVPRLGRYDIALMIERVLDGESYAAALMDVVVRTCQTPEDVRYVLMQLIHQQALVWDAKMRCWRITTTDAPPLMIATTAIPDTIVPVVRFFEVMRDAVPEAVVAAIPWPHEIDIAVALEVLVAQGVIMHEQGKYWISTYWMSHGGRHDDTSDVAYEQAHRLALQCSEGLAYIEHAVALGEYVLAYAALQDAVNVAWQYGNAIRMRRCLRLMQELLERHDDAELRWLQALTIVRLARFGEASEHVHQALGVLRTHQYRSPHHEVECMVHVALVLRWGGLPHEAMEILEQVYPRAVALHESRAVFTIVHTLIYANFDYGAVANGVAWLERLPTTSLGILEQITTMLTRSYVLARVGDTTSARQLVAHVEHVAGTANVRTVAFMQYHLGIIACAAMAYVPSVEHLHLAWQRTFEVGEVLTHLMSGALLCLVHARHGQFDRLMSIAPIVVSQSTVLQLTRQRLLAISAQVRMWLAHGAYTQALAVLEETYHEAVYHQLREYAVALVGLAMMAQRQGKLPDTVWESRLVQGLRQLPTYQVSLWQHELAWVYYQRRQYGPAVEYALAAIENAETYRMQPITPLEVMMHAWGVLQRCRYAQIAPLTARVGEALLTALRALDDPFQRQCYLAILPDSQAWCEIALGSTHQSIWHLPHKDAPRGKPLQYHDLVPVILMIPMSSQQDIMLVERIEHIVMQAESQQACVTIKHLAKMMHVHERTVLRALKQARIVGKHITTFRPRYVAPDDDSE